MSVAAIAGTQYGLRRLLRKLATKKPTCRFGRGLAVFYSAGVPSDNDSGSLATADGDLCIDTTDGDDIYVASAVTVGSTLTTWTKIVD